MVLLGLVLRALGVALMAATVLLPVADHHAATRLPYATPDAVSLRELVTHHHSHARHGLPRAAARALADAPVVPTVLPAASSWAEGAGAAHAALGAAGLVPRLSSFGRLGADAAGRPRSLERAPPPPVPLFSA